MAKFTDVNSIPATDSEAIFKLKAVLKAAGWIVNKSSDGTTYNPGGDQITVPGAGAGGMLNTNAWFEIQEPETYGRSWVFQYMGTTRYWRIKISAGAGFSGGTPGITQVPSASDEVVVSGAGTDASPTGTTSFPTSGGYRIHCIAQSVPEGPAGNRCYGWWFFSTQNGSGNAYTLMGQEPMAEGTYALLEGTRIAPTKGEADPVIYLRDYSYNAFNWGSTPPSWGENQPTGQVPKAWWRYGYSNAVWVNDWGSNNGNLFGDNGRFIGEMGTGWTGRDIARRFEIGRSYEYNYYNSEIGSKGRTTVLAQRGTAGRVYPDTINLATDAYVYVQDLLFPWEDGTTPLA